MSERESDHKHEHDPYWQHDIAVDLAQAEPHPGIPIRLRIREASEPYFHGAREIVPLNSPRGMRHSFQAKPYILESDIVRTGGLFPELATNGTATGVVGQVTESYWPGLRHRDIGQLQAWYYPEDATLVVGECSLHERYQNEPPDEDALLGALWRGWERWLVNQCPDTRRIVTPMASRSYHPDHWHAFLEAQGYQPFTEQVFVKEMASL